jgi:hypothetical protein
MDSKRPAKTRTVDKSPRYHAYRTKKREKGIDKSPIYNISKIAENVKMFNIPQTHTYKKLADYCTSSRQRSMSKSQIKTKYKINTDRSEEISSEKHTYVNKYEREDRREKDRRRSREFKNQQQRPVAKKETPKLNSDRLKQKAIGSNTSHPVKLTPAGINRNIFKNTKIPQISKKSILLHEDNKSLSKSGNGLNRYLSTGRITRVSILWLIC